MIIWTRLSGWGRVALVTGAARGHAIAQALGQAGAKVVVNDLSAQACDAACERLRAAGIQAQARRSTWPTRPSHRLRELEAAGWAPRAGQQRWQPEPQAVVEMTPAEWQALQSVRQRRLQLRPRGAGHGPARLRPHRADVVRGRAGHHAQHRHATAKGAIAAFARALAVEYGGSGITCNALAPGFVRTDFTQGLRTIRSSSPSCPRRCRPDAGPSRTISRRRWCTRPRAAFVNGPGAGDRRRPLRARPP